MGRLINGIMGPFRGKVGPIVGYTWKGQGVIRSLPRKITKAPSQEQLDNRKKMASCQRWLKLLTPMVRIGFRDYSAKQHGFGNALSYHKLNAMNQDFEVDPAKAFISWGDLPQPISPKVSNNKPGKLQITWEAVPFNKDRAMFVAYDGKNIALGEVSGPRRSEGKVVLACTGLKGIEMHVYLSFVSEERDRCSTSVYLGLVRIK